MSGTLLRSLLVMSLSFVGVAAAAEPGYDPARLPDHAGLVAALRPHPRLLLPEARLSQLRTQAASDPQLARFVQQVLTAADGLAAARRKAAGAASAPLIEHDQLLLLGFAERWTGDPARRQVALQAATKLLAGAGWIDANELEHASGLATAALAWDWYGADLTPPQRTTALAHFAASLARFRPFYTAGREGSWQVNNNYNWSGWLNGAIVRAALALGTDLPSADRALIQPALRNLRQYVDSHAPDGVGFEGPGYWIYGIQPLILTCEALRTATGTDFGLSDSPGLARSGAWCIASLKPDDGYAVFSDSPGNWGDWNVPALMWLGRRYQRPDYAARQLWYAREFPPRNPLFLALWHPDRPPEPAVAGLPLDRVFGGTLCPMAFTRSDPVQRDALWAYLKAGRLANHQFLDWGTFEFAALGETWAVGLDKDDYGLYHRQGYGTQEGFDRVFRRNNRSRNVVTLNDAAMPIMAKTSLIRYASGPEGMHAVAELREAYPAASSAQRGLRSFGGRRALLVQDEFTLRAPTLVQWSMMTEAKIAVEGATARLTKQGKTVTARILSPADAVFTVRSAAQKPPQKKNEGFNRLTIEVREAQGAVRLAVTLSPEWPEGAVTMAPTQVVPLAKWPGKAPAEGGSDP